MTLEAPHCEGTPELFFSAKYPLILLVGDVFFPFQTHYLRLFIKKRMRKSLLKKVPFLEITASLLMHMHYGKVGGR